MAIKPSNQITFTEHKKIVEIKEWYLATPDGSGVTIDTSGWTTDIQTIDYTNKYLWNYEEVVYSIGSPDISEPIIIGFYGKGADGVSGRGIVNIINYYQVTKNTDMPSTDVLWPTVAPMLTPTNKYLWHYEVINYTDDSKTTTDPAIIGVYGDSGGDASAVVFEIYSPHGFVFKDDLEDIELKIAAFKNGEAITDATYTWLWYDDSVGEYTVIVENTSESFFIVNSLSQYAYSSLKCIMHYDEKTYEDYVSLTDESVIYSAVVKFFDGKNIFNATDLYLLAYVELYKNNHLIETVATKTYCSGLVTISTSGIITTNMQNEAVDGDKMYFVYQDDNNIYQTVLGEYTSGVWRVVDDGIKYIYTNSLYSTITSNVIAISKEYINKSQNIDWAIYKDEAYVTNVSAMVIDSNDPIVSNVEPTNPIYNQLWLDTSVTPNKLKMFVKPADQDVGQWVDCSKSAGGTVYTSQPATYSEGDLWILAENEVCNSFGPGSMLKASTSSNVFNTSHWIDTNSVETELQNNIAQTFAFNPNNDSSKGLPGLTIGQTNNAFYVNVSSTEMGFYDNTENQNQKVVKLGNNSATIQEAKLKGNTAFYGQLNICDPDSNPDDNTEDVLFVWKVEHNGSLSLAKVNK